jgi:hypothetical protein
MRMISPTCVGWPGSVGQVDLRLSQGNPDRQRCQHEAQREHGTYQDERLVMMSISR